MFQVLLFSIFDNYSLTHVAADELHQAGHVRHEEGGGQGQTRLFGSSEAALRGEELLDGENDLIFENIFNRC